MSDWDDCYKEEDIIDMENVARKSYEEHKDVNRYSLKKSEYVFLMNYDILLAKLLDFKSMVTKKEISLLLQNYAFWDQEIADKYITQDKHPTFHSLFIALIHKNIVYMSLEEREYYMEPSTLQHIVFVMCNDQYLYSKWLPMFLDITVIHLLSTPQIKLEIGEPFMNKFNDCFHYTNGYLLVGILIQNNYTLNIDITIMVDCFHMAYYLLTTNKAIYFKYIYWIIFLIIQMIPVL